MTLNEQAGRLIARSAQEAKRLAATARASARGRGAKAKLRAANHLEELASRCGKAAEQIDRRVRGLKIQDRLVSLADPDPQGQARQTDRVRIRRSDLRDHREHPQGSPRVHPARWSRTWEPEREHAAAPDRRRTRPGWDPRQRDRPRRRLSATPHVRGVPQPHRPADPALRPPRTRQPTHPQTQSPLPNRDRGSDQSPQTPLRPAPVQAQRRSRDEDLNRIGDPRLRPRHSPSEPAETLLKSPTPPGRPFTSLTRPRHPSAAVSVQAVYPGQVAS